MTCRCSPASGPPDLWPAASALWGRSEPPPPSASPRSAPLVVVRHWCHLGVMCSSNGGVQEKAIFFFLKAVHWVRFDKLAAYLMKHTFSMSRILSCISLRAHWDSASFSLACTSSLSSCRTDSSEKRGAPFYNQKHHAQVSGDCKPELQVSIPVCPRWWTIQPPSHVSQNSINNSTSLINPYYTTYINPSGEHTSEHLHTSLQKNSTLILDDRAFGLLLAHK